MLVVINLFFWIQGDQQLMQFKERLSKLEKNKTEHGDLRGELAEIKRSMKCLLEVCIFLHSIA